MMQSSCWCVAVRRRLSMYAESEFCMCVCLLCVCVCCVSVCVCLDVCIFNIHIVLTHFYVDLSIDDH